MVEVKWTELAILDLNDIGEYISKDSIRYAEITIERLFVSIDILESNPYAGRVVPEFGTESIREIIKGNYRIVYRVVSEKRIDILSVHHSKRLLSNNPFLKGLFNED
jgi:addiction module RelE/StbE family toxin